VLAHARTTYILTDLNVHMMQSECGDEGLPCTCEDVAQFASSPFWPSIVRQRSDISASYGTENVEGTSLIYNVTRYVHAPKCLFNQHGPNRRFLYSFRPALCDASVFDCVRRHVYVCLYVVCFYAQKRLSGMYRIRTLTVPHAGNCP